MSEVYLQQHPDMHETFAAVTAESSLDLNGHQVCFVQQR